MKRWITLLLATVVLLMAAGCGEKTEKLPDASLENPQITASQIHRHPRQPLRQIRRKQKRPVF